MNLPKDFTDRTRAMLGDEYDEFIAAFENSPIYSGIRINTLRPDALRAVEAEFGELERVDWCDVGFYADKSKISGNHPYHMAGLFYFQEPSAMCAASALPVNEGDFVLDLCAAPGGKTTQAAAKLNNTGLLVANEIVKGRAQILSENVERMGLTTAIVTNESPDALAKKYVGFFDKIIVDAPCSGEGMFRKEPQAVTEWSLEHTISCGARQKNILDSAFTMLKKGGMLVYSTCTFAPEENEKIAAYLIEKGMELCEMPELSTLCEGKTEWSGSDYDMSRTRRIFPHKQKGEGHFAALFRKVTECEGITEKKKKNNKRTDTSVLDYSISQYRKFEKETLKTTLDGEFVLFGDNLYLKPEGIDIDKIRVVRCGLHLGTVKKNRFEPSHALALALKSDEVRNVNFTLDDGDLYKYLHGEVVPCNENGWCAVCVNGFCLGWGKASGGVLKNHYPKGLRLK